MSLVWIDLETTGLEAHKEQVLEVAAIITDDALNEVARFQRVIYSPAADRVLRRVPEFDAKLAEIVRARDENRAEYLKNETVYEKWVLGCYRFHDTGEHDVDPYVVKMHLDNGLWKEVRHGQALATVDADLAELISEHGIREVTYVDMIGLVPVVRGRQDKPQLAGSTISFDRAFLAVHFPKTLETLHYRNLDTSTLNEVGRRFWNEVYESRPRADKDAHRGMADIELSIDVTKHYLASLAPVPTNVPVQEAA